MRTAEFTSFVDDYYERFAEILRSFDKRPLEGVARVFLQVRQAGGTIWVAGNGDVFLVPRGYHGPCVAAPGYPMYYLNVLAGPGGDRSMAFCDDPTHHWVRDAWEGMETDPRCPMTTADGVVQKESPA